MGDYFLKTQRFIKSPSLPLLPPSDRLSQAKRA